MPGPRRLRELHALYRVMCCFRVKTERGRYHMDATLQPTAVQQHLPDTTAMYEAVIFGLWRYSRQYDSDVMWFKPTPGTWCVVGTWNRCCRTAMHNRTKWTGHEHPSRFFSNVQIRSQNSTGLFLSSWVNGINEPGTSVHP